MYHKNMRFSLVFSVLCLGFAPDIMAAPSVRVLGGGASGATTSGTTVSASGVTGLSGTKAVPVNTANRVNTSVLGTGNLATKKTSAVKVGSTPAATIVQPVARTTANANTSRIGSISANAVNGTGRIPTMKLPSKIQTTYRPVQVATPTEPTPAPEVDLSNYYTKPEIDEMLEGLDINVETVTNLTEVANQTVQQLYETTNTIYNVKTNQRELVYVADIDDFDHGMFDSLETAEETD